MKRRLSEKRIIKFIKWLTSQGAEMLPTSDKREAVRFRCSQGIGVIHRNSKGLYSVSGPVATEAVIAYFSGEKWARKAKPTVRSYVNKRKKELLKRDGNECFYCGRSLGEDVTEEHLVALNQGGPDRLENLVLAHRACNNDAGNLPVIEKVRLREKMRAEVNKK
ncbi:HNH endonuclease [Microbulbifer sp. 2205BS26-8]|uniref:HNH endonuclease n=1 Tax=Microbulbifer sp. 2205BS26-8 TaxID=3064386 RepID=UPI0027401B8C|nr:HNH endonuclease [Microbulbifer sp. 2205BS26-8]MDP5211188.1 HNH endonuclease [Microbulbifer sp. 2205BS26-8]